nr:hypothetical protein [Bacteroidales bacterium]
MKPCLERYLPYAVAAVLFVLLGFLYCKPVLTGKVMQSDDGSSAIANVQEGVRYTAATGDYSWWTGSMFSGMPAYQVGGGSYRADRILAPFKDFL